ncbi:MAG: formylglycine-generating enzyme family protein [Haliscomenobacter sp.]|nr:formylglycine-generating enzyme family protein [Haliscomenobacter sp.]
MSEPLAPVQYLETLPGGAAFEMIRIEGGSFVMGDDDAPYKDEKPAHLVQIPDFYLGKFPVTQALWQAVMGDNPSSFQGPNRPVVQVSWIDVQTFLKKLNTRTGKTYRLPSEAEWQYAARGGHRSQGFTYSGGNKLNEVGWYDENSHAETKPVGLKQPNELGLYDMSGNVWEWCADVWHDNYEGAPDDGSAWTTGGDQDLRVVRGGSWFFDDCYCRVSSRNRVRSVGGATFSVFV